MPQSQGGVSHLNAASSGEYLGVWAAARTAIVGREEERGPKLANGDYRDKKSYWGN